MTHTSRASQWLALAALAACLGATTPAQAAKADNDGVVIDTDNNVVLAGGRIGPSRPVPENFVGAGGSVVIDQPVGESAVAAGGTVDIRAPIGENLRAAGGTVHIASKVGGNLAAAGGDVRIGKDAVIGGPARVFGGSITIDGTIEGKLRASAETLTINGTVNGDVRAAADQVVLGPAAKINGALSYVSGAELKKADGAAVTGPVTRLDERTAESEWAADVKPKHSGTIIGTLLSYLVLVGCGALFISVAPIFSVEAPERIALSPARSFGMGLASLVGVPLAAVLFIMTLVGIPVGVILFMLYPFALLLGFIVGALWLAGLLPRVLKRPPPPTVRAAIANFAIALAIVMLAGKVPAVGGLAVFLLLVMGVGAFEVELYRRMRSGSQGARGRVEVVRP